MRIRLCLIAALTLAPLAAHANRIDSLGTHVFHTSLDNASTDVFPFDVTLPGGGGSSQWLGEQRGPAAVRLFGINVGIADTSNIFASIGEPILFTLDEPALVRISGFADFQPGPFGFDGGLSASVCEVGSIGGPCGPEVFKSSPFSEFFDESAWLGPGSYAFEYVIFAQVPGAEVGYDVLLTIPEPATAALLAASLLALAARSRKLDTRKR